MSIKNRIPLRLRSNAAVFSGGMAVTEPLLQFIPAGRFGSNPPKDGNLLNQTRIHVKRPIEFYVALILEGLAIALALATSYFAVAYFLGAGSLWFALAAGTAYIGFSAVVTLWTRSAWRRIQVLVLESLALVAFFYTLQPVYIFIVWAVLFFFSLWGETASRMIFNNSLDLKFFRSTRPRILKTITGFIVAFVVLYPVYNPQALLPSENITQSVFASSMQIVSSFYPGLGAASTVDAFVKEAVRVQLENNPKYLALSPEEQDASVAQSAQATEARLESTFGVPVKGDMLVSDFFASAVRVKLAEYQQGLGSSFVFIWMIVVFFLIRSLGALYYFFVAIISYLFYQIAIAADIVHVASESRSHEFVEISQKF